MDAQSVILEMVKASSGNLTQKEIIKQVKKKSNTVDYDKKAVKKVLKQLVKAGTIGLAANEKKLYCRRVSHSSSSKSKATTESSKSKSKRKNDDSSIDDENDNANGDQPIPFAEALRRRMQKETNSKPSKIVEPKKEEVVEDIDDEIARLEAELNADNSDDSEGESDEDDDDQQNTDAAGGVISLSTLATDRIAALPDTALPFNKRRKLKGIDKAEASDEPKSKRRKKDSSGSSENNNISDGLRAAVKLVLDGYTPRSNEKIPFYCRVCAKQYKNADEFFDHKKGEFHRAAVDIEKKASYCKLCRKQLTSTVQLKEHLQSKPHKDRLNMLRNRQPRPNR